MGNRNQMVHRCRVQAARLMIQPCCCVVVACGAIFAPAGALAQPPDAATTQDVPNAEVVLDKMIEASGGRAAFERIENRVIKGTFEFPGMAIKTPITIYQAEPNSEYTVIEPESLGKIRDCTHNDLSWKISAVEGPHLRAGFERDRAIDLARFNREIHWRDLYTKAECVGLEDVQGHPCYKLAMTPACGGEEQLEHWYIAKDSHLWLRWDFKYVMERGSIPLEAIFTDHKAVDGLVMPFRSIHRVMGVERTVTIDSLEQNVELPEGLFDPPPEIKKMLEEQAKPPAEPAVTS